MRRLRRRKSKADDGGGQAEGRREVRGPGKAVLRRADGRHRVASWESFKRGEGKLAKVIEDQVFALNTGEVTPPIRTRQGFILLKVTDHTQAGVQPLKAVEPQVQQAIYEEAIQPALRTYLTNLRDNAFIEIQPGFVDTGASPKQIKALFAASTPPPLKKKARRRRGWSGRRTAERSCAKPAVRRRLPR